MKSNRPLSLKLLPLGLSMLVAGSGSSLVAQGITDDFNDGNDDGWIRYDPIASEPEYGDQGTWSFPNGAFRLQAAGSPAPNLFGPARIGSLRPEVYSDFYATVDVVDWEESLVEQAIALIGRLTDSGLFTTKCYLMAYQAGTRDIHIERIADENFERLVGPSSNVTLVPGKTYRFTFSGKGALLTGQVFELPDTENPIVEVSGTDTDPYQSGINGLIIIDNSSSWDSPADVTFDNYFSTDVVPPRIIPRPRLKFRDLGFRELELSWPSNESQFVLQSSTSLSGSTTDWTDVSVADIIPPTDIDPSFRYYVGAAQQAGGLLRQFFRLIRRESIPE